MDSPESTPENPNDEEPTKLNNESEEKIQCSEEVPRNEAKTKREVTTKNKRVSFHFGTALSARREQSASHSKDITFTTIQNIYESKATEPNAEDDADLVRTNSTRSRINKSAYIKLHRHSFSSTGNSSVDKLKGRYENIAKQTDNNSKANIVTRAKANTDNASTNSLKNSIGDKQGKNLDLNPPQVKSVDALKAEFINSQPVVPQNPQETETPELPVPKFPESPEASRVTQTPKEETKTERTESAESLLSKTTSNIEKLQNNLSTKLSSDTIEKLRSKYSPASFGYPKSPKRVQFSQETTSKLPVPTPRISFKPENKEDNKSEVENILAFKPENTQDSKSEVENIPAFKPEYKEDTKSELENISALKPENKEDSKSEVEFISEDKCENSNAQLAPSTTKEEVQSLTVKLIAVPEVTEESNKESVSQPPVLEEKVKAKDENSNVVNETVATNEKPKSKPLVSPKPNISERVVQTAATQQLDDNFQVQSTLVETTGIEVEVTYDHIEFAVPEEKHFIVRRSSSEDSVDKVENFFSEIIMEKKPKEKKRSNSFKKILTGGLFGRDKKKPDEEKPKHKKKDNAVFADNAQNESQAFDRKSTHRHTIDNSFPRREAQKNAFQSNASSGPLYYYPPQTQYKKTSDNTSFQNRYTEMKGNNISPFVSNRHPKYSPEEYVPMDNGNPGKVLGDNQTSYMNVSKYIDTSSSSSNTLDSENRNCTYQNALIAQAELRQIRENEHIQKNNQRSGIPVNLNRKKSSGSQENRFVSHTKHSNSPELFRESPPCSQESARNVQLVKPKALIPINSERPLPNPYHNNQDRTDNSANYENFESSKTLNRNLNSDSSKPFPHKNNLYERTEDPVRRITNNHIVVEDVYGTVFDSISPQNSAQTNLDYLRTRSLSPQHSQRSGSSGNSPSSKIPTSPRSLEASKLKLPPNREKVELQPRIRSPIPQAKISTDKIIATELLRNKRSPTRNSPVLRVETQERSPPKLQRSPHVSPTRPASYQGMCIYENSSDLSETRNLASPRSIGPIRVSPNINLVHSSPQNVSQTRPNEYMYLNTLTPIPKNRPPLSPKDASVTDCIQAGEWQRKQRELAKSPALESPQQITTNVMVHVNPEEERFVTGNNYPSLPLTVRQRTPVYQIQPQIYHAQAQPPSPRSLNSSLSNVRPHTPIQQFAPSPLPKSPEKQHILQNVEAFYWRELKKLKEKEEQDLLNYRRQQLHVYGYVEDPVFTRRSRSVSPSMQRGRRSLSLPREARSLQVTGRPQLRSPETIPEGRPVIAKKPIVLPTEAAYGQVRSPLQRNPNFIRNAFERSTIGPIGMSKNSTLLYENYHPALDGARGFKQQQYTPIFKRGSLTGTVLSPETQLQMSKKVSFLSTQNSQNPSSWPTKNGFTKSPPTRRVEREVSMDDDVFLPNSPRIPQNRQVEEIYVRNNIEADPIYVARQQQYQQMVQKNRGREVDYASRVPKSEVDYVERRAQEINRQAESLYGTTGPKQITMSNKVCDIYGQIHDPRQRSAVSHQNYGQLQNSGQGTMVGSQNYGQIRQAGLMYGQLQHNPKTQSPIVLRQSYNQLNAPQNNFVRGTRLTASVNDMYKRYPGENARHVFDPRYQADVIYSNEKTTEAPYRPLPPLPERKDSRAITNRKMGRGYVPVSDTESGSEAGEVQRILQSGTKQKNFSVIEEEWNSDGKSGRASGNESGGSRGENEGEIKSGRSRSARREDPRRHTLSGDQHYSMAGQGGPLSRTMDLEGQFARGYPPSSNAMLFDDDPGIMSEVETSSTGFRRGGKQRSSLPVVRTPSKTLERPLGLVFLQYRNETKRALLPNEITSIDTVKALFVRSFPKQLSMEYLDSPLVKIYIHDSSKDMFYELEDVRSHLREIRDRSVLRLFESTDVSGGLPMGGVGIPGGIGHFEDPSYFSEPEFDSEYQHQHIHKSKGSAGKGAPYYMGSTTSLPRGGPLLRPYSPAVGALPPDRLKTLPAGAPPKPQRAYSSGATRASDGSSRPPDRFAPFQRPANPLFNLPDGYMSSPERGSRGYEDPYYSQYTSRSGSITPVIDEEVSDTELLDEQYSLYGVKLAPGGAQRGVRSQFPGPAAPPYDTTRLRVEHMERQLANLTGLVQKALTQTPTPRDFLAPPGRDAYRSGDEFDKNSSSSSASLPDKSVSFEKSVSFSDEPPDMNSPKQHSPQHAADTKPPKPAIKSSTLPRTSSQEKDRLKPAPPPKPASLSPGQYDTRHIYRDLQLTPEMYNQLRGLQKKAKDLRAEVRNLRRMSQAQAHSVRETIRDTFIKIRAMLMAGGEQVWQAGMDQERVRLSRDEDLYKQEMLRLEKDLTDLEASVEELRGNVINRKTRVNMSDVENMALVLSKSSKTVADLKLRFPGLQDSMKAFLSSEMDKVVREEKFLKEEPERLESALRRCKKLTGTLVTLKRLASVQEQRLPCSTSATDGRISPSSITETPPITPTSGQHSKPPSGARMGQVGFGGDGSNAADSNQRPENALDALLDELQTFSKPHPATVNTQMPQGSYSDSTPSDPPAIPVKGIPPSHSAHFGHPHMSEIGRKGSMDSAAILPTQNLTVSTTTGSLRRLHSYPSGSDTDNSPPIQPLRTQMDGKTFNKPPIPERNAELLQHIASGRRVPPPPPPRTSSKSPLASPTSPSLPPRSPATGLQHIQNVQNMTEKPQSQFEAATQNLGLSTLRRNVPNRSSMKDNKAQTLPRNIGSNLQVHTQAVTGSELQNVSSSSCESVNSQDGTKKGSRKEELEQRHQELLKKQKALQEQYARLQQLQRGNNTLAVVPPAPDQLLKKTGSESNLLQKMGLQMATAQMTGSLTHLPSTTTNTGNNVTNTATNTSTSQPPNTTADTSATDNSSSSSTTTTSKVYETDIL